MKLLFLLISVFCLTSCSSESEKLRVSIIDKFGNPDNITERENIYRLEYIPAGQDFFALYPKIRQHITKVTELQSKDEEKEITRDESTIIGKTIFVYRYKWDNPKMFITLEKFVISQSKQESKVWVTVENK